MLVFSTSNLKKNLKQAQQSKQNKKQQYYLLSQSPQWLQATCQLIHRQTSTNWLTRHQS